MVSPLIPYLKIREGLPGKYTPRRDARALGPNRGPGEEGRRSMDSVTMTQRGMEDEGFPGLPLFSLLRGVLTTSYLLVQAPAC